MARNVVCDGAECKCSQGSAPAKLKVTLNTILTIAGKPVATVNDCLPTSFLPPVATFGPCKMMPLPTGGYLPCVPALAPPWLPGASIEKVLGMKVLTKDSKLTCALGGQVTISDPQCGVDVKTQ